MLNSEVHDGLTLCTFVHILLNVEHEWDSRKAALNLQKHGVDFTDVIGAFEDPLAITISDDRHREQRFVTIGMDFLSRLVVIAYTWRGERIRIISARKATLKERRQYEG